MSLLSDYLSAVHKLESTANLQEDWRLTSLADLKASMLRIRKLLNKLGNPERNFKYIHVTGTSGKGSVTNLIHEMLLTDKRNVASYLSPHTTTFLERFRVNEKLASPRVVVESINTVLAAYQTCLNTGTPPLSYFELAWCVALVTFRSAEVAWCVIEVGMGGRWDATNIIPDCAVAVITNIDYDHVDIIGPTLKRIAFEKAGIIKKGSVVVTGEERRGLRKVIIDEAEKYKAPVHYVKRVGDDHRLHNALIAAAAAQQVGVSMKIIEQAVSKTQPLPCRFELIDKQPLVIIDGAHNAAKIQSTVDRVQAMKYRRLHVIFGCKSTKKAEELAAPLRKIADFVTTTRATQGHGKPHNPATLLKLFTAKQRQGAFLFPHEALDQVLKKAKKDDLILITGSLYLAGELRTHWVSEEEIVRARLLR